ncbi:flagellar hook-associated 2 domain-containing protein [Desulfurispirillum indicum S5]|uniref:Filament cap protein n=1 Tax=Desulfurispirillum indicum (strain ATCC BAA-1389 / DSM 22839 / S5) TaxID=653733 RepID=E6W1U0_DESIS|nr:flagellar filament capping protein FliD [Desulfurispirillum indicum]ADU65472.1 flagellar hook-associated 2 domain-containing protein [Desulfurispirillum indicum S5]
MGGVNFQGLSGLPMGELMDKMLEVRGQTMNRLLDNRELVQIKKNAFMDVNNDMMTLRNQLLDMNLRSTYYNREVSSSNEALVSGTAEWNAAKTSHTVEVIQAAKGASASSYYTRSAISEAVVKNTTNISAISSYYEGMLSGKHDILIERTGTDEGYVIATNRIALDNKPTMQAIMGTGISATAAGTHGTIANEITAGSTLELNVNGTTVTVTMEDGFSAGTTLATVSNVLDTKINDALNVANGTIDQRYVAVGDSGYWGRSGDARSGLVIYNTALSTSESLDIVGGSALSALGLDTTQKNTMNHITKSTAVAYADAADVDAAFATLRTQMGESYTEGPPPSFNSIMDGAMNFQLASGTTLQEGSMRIITGTELRLGEDSHSRVTGSAVGAIDTAQKLSEAGLSGFGSDAAEGYFTINGVKINILLNTTKKDAEGNVNPNPDPNPDPTVNEMLAAINSSGAGVTASFDGQRFYLTANEPGQGTIKVGDTGDTSTFLSMAGLTVPAGATQKAGAMNPAADPTLVPTGLGIRTGIFTVNGVSIYVDSAKDSLNSIIDKINNSGANVIASYDTASDSFHITSKLRDGHSNQNYIVFGSENDTSNFLRQMNVIEHDPAVSLANGYPMVTYQGERGQDALIRYDGVLYTKTVNDIKGMPGGVNLNIKGPTQGAVTLNVTGETDTALDRIATFIANYNTLMERITPSRLTDEQKSYLQPLSNEKMQSMTFAEQDRYMENFELYNKQEYIRKSSESRSISATLRRIMTDFYGEAGSSIRSLGDIGIEIAGKDDYALLQKGMLLMDSTDKDEIKAALKENTRFMSALENDEEAVYNLFAQEDSEGNPIGIARRLNEVVSEYVFAGGMIHNKTRTGGFIDNELDRINRSIASEQRSLQAYENALKRQFASLESRISDMQSQSAAIASIVSPGQS